MAESVYSYSSLNMFRTCPKQYQFKKIDRIELPSRVSADIRLGNLVHKQLEQMYKWAADGKLIPLSRVLEDHRRAWEETDMAKLVIIQESLAVDDFIAMGEKMLKAFYEKYQPFDHGVLLGAEMNLKFRLGTTPFELTAKIDRLTRLPDGTVEIVDYKTGRVPPPNGKNDESFRRQLGLYELAVRTNHPNIEKIVQIQHWLRQDYPLDRVARPDELDELSEELRQDVIAIKEALRNNHFPPVEGHQCGLCDYVDICPAKRHRRILDEESGIEGDEKELAVMARERTQQLIELDRQAKELKNRQDKLKLELIEIAKQTGLNKFEGDSGTAKVYLKTEQGLVTKAEDADLVNKLTMLIRDWGYEECLALNRFEILKLYRKQMLPPEQLKELERFIVEKESEQIRIYPDKTDDD